MKKHEDFVTNNTAERYVLGSLSGKDKFFFEEHMLLCDICAEEVKQLYSITSIVEETILSTELENDLPVPKRNENNKSIGLYLKIAAGIAILAALSWFIIWYIENNSKPNDTLASEHKNTNKIEKTISNIIIDTLSSKKIVAEDVNKEKYIPLERFESQLNQVYRSVIIDKVIPKNGQKFKTTDIINFTWEKQGDELLILMIYNNKGKNIFQKELKTDTITKIISEPGLYYWQLETEDDIAYTGKFMVKEVGSGAK